MLLTASLFPQTAFFVAPSFRPDQFAPSTLRSLPWLPMLNRRAVLSYSVLPGRRFLLSILAIFVFMQWFEDPGWRYVPTTRSQMHLRVFCKKASESKIFERSENNIVSADCTKHEGPKTTTVLMRESFLFTTVDSDHSCVFAANLSRWRKRHGCSQ
ncbi:hypothetical protein AUEXF2481DRAFT_664212 [Aureobasidium subglaciale EXF-2481]|uniref:Uncharacterized protein n=1 Tax=Aureobasidium subglaciale (strain EXF-2481) TaxID=1043005 RepID=A0A074YED0_AURSE|nr:uncharacterized protein AUEXF2481DRAFT_664212 [Aureobasidium subglaciale EXF-2481]KEQ96133.1 hypothetical protein AUEXF2481DRAFT_664212 [Aureobasidium subglaciale EXF-2481]